MTALIVRSRDVAANLAGRIEKYGNLRDCPIRKQFFEPGDAGQPSPLIAILGKSDVRLKLFLSLMWASPGGQHDTAWPANEWAQLLGLDQSATNGRDRVQRELSWLRDHRFVSIKVNPGQPALVTLLDERGTGLKYTKPSAATDVGTYTYVNMEAAWFTNGWIAAMSSRSLAFWLMMKHYRKGHEGGDQVWFSATVSREQYGFSDHLRQKAMRELEAHGLTSTYRKRSAFTTNGSRTEIHRYPMQLRVNADDEPAGQLGLSVPNVSPERNPGAVSA